MATPTPQTVIYRFDEAHRPQWQFHSMPESAVGGGNTLDEAREEYRDALRFLLDTDLLPAISEYVEREVGSLGIWIRTPLDMPTSDEAFRNIASQIVQYGPQDRAWFYHHRTAGGDPVVVPSTADVPLSSIFRQMTPFDSLIAVMAFYKDEDLRTAWIVINGVAADRDKRYAPTSLEKLGLTPVSSLGQLREGAVRIYGDRPAELLAPA